MRGIDLRASRERLGATHQQIAERSGLGTADVKGWESFGEVPRKHRFAVDMALWQIECEQVLARSGYPQCEVSRGWEERPWEMHGDEIGRHVIDCPMCTAREEYIQTHLRPAPIGAHPLLRISGFVGRLRGWIRSAAVGALGMLMVGGVGVLLLLGRAVLGRDPTYLGYAAGLLALLVVGGAAGGIVHYLTTRVRQSGTIGYYASHVLTVYGYLLAVFGMLALAALLIGDAGAAQVDLSRWGDPIQWALMLVMGVLFGIALGRVLREKQAPDPGRPPRQRLLSIRNAGVALLFLGGIALRFLTGDDVVPPTPEQLEATLPALQAAVLEHPDDAAAFAQLASTLGALERWDESRKALQSAVRLSPNDGELLHTLGWMTLRMGEPNEAVPFLERATSLDPADSDVWLNLAVALNLSGRMAEAENAYRVVIGADAAIAQAHAGLGWVLLQQGRLSEAEQGFREAVRLEPSTAGFHRGLAVALMQNGQPQAALASYRTAARLTPEDAGLWGDIGRLAHVAGEHEESAAAFARAGELDAGVLGGSPEAPDVWEASREGRQDHPPGR